jgi:hypothetical protein
LYPGRFWTCEQLMNRQPRNAVTDGPDQPIIVEQRSHLMIRTDPDETVMLPITKVQATCFIKYHPLCLYLFFDPEKNKLYRQLNKRG